MGSVPGPAAYMAGLPVRLNSMPQNEDKTNLSCRRNVGLQREDVNTYNHLSHPSRTARTAPRRLPRRSAGNAFPTPCYRIGILERFRTPRGPAAGAIAGERSPERASVFAVVGISPRER